MADKSKTRSNAGMGVALARAAATYGDVHAGISNRLERVRTAAEAFLWEALTLEEKASIAVRIFEHRAEYGPPGLHAWEEQWYRRDLPQPPARVLVGGAGSGREMLALIGSGYSVEGFEPATSLCRRARERLPTSIPVWTLGYEDCVARGADSEPARRAPYDAVLLGWGSFSHVLDRAMREEVIQFAHRMSPRGPILLSFHLKSAAARRPPGESVRLAQRLGRGLARLRGVHAADSDAALFLPHAGFLHRFTREEIEALAQTVRRTPRWGSSTSGAPHCSFIADPVS